MDAQPGTTPSTRQWVSADEWLKTVEDTPDVPLRSIARPVNAASDEECYALNPPMHRTRGKGPFRGAGIRQPRRTQRALAIERAEQAARELAARRIDDSSERRILFGQANA